MVKSGGIRFQLDVDGEQQLDRGLSRFGKALTDVRPFFETMENVLERSIAQQFATQGAGRWRPLSARYAAWKASRMGSKPILQASGELMRSFKRRRMTKDRLEWGSQLKRGVFHHRGTRKMPQRKIVWLSEGEKRSAMKELQRFLVSSGYPGER